MAESERRRERRITFYAEAELFGLAGRHQVRLADLSVTGAFIDTRTVLPVGARSQLRFTLPSKAVSVDVEVRYSVPAIGMGVRFVDLAPEDRAAIEALIAQQS